MNPDPSRGNPDDAPAAAVPAAIVGADTDTVGPDSGTVPGCELFESIALEAVTASMSPTSACGAGVAVPDDSLSDSEPMTLGEPDPMVGRRIGPYELTARIGGGGMGTV